MFLKKSDCWIKPDREGRKKGMNVDVDVDVGRRGGSMGMV